MSRATNSKHAYEENDLSLLVMILRGTAALPDAACIGHAELFDPAGRSEPVEHVARRHQVAAHICTSCPVLADCAAWAAGLPDDGMVRAGHIPPRAGRPRAEAKAS